MPAQFWEAVLNSPGNGAGTAMTASATATDISPAPQLVLPANFLYIGQALRLTAFGVYTTNTTGTNNLTLGFYYGGVAGATPLALALNAATQTNSLTNVPWRMELLVTIRSLGTSGTAMSQGLANIGSSVSAWSSIPIPPTALATVTINTTAANALTVGATWSAASNSITCHGFTVEAMN